MVSSEIKKSPQYYGVLLTRKILNFVSRHDIFLLEWMESIPVICGWYRMNIVTIFSLHDFINRIYTILFYKYSIGKYTVLQKKLYVLKIYMYTQFLYLYITLLSYNFKLLLNMSLHLLHTLVNTYSVKIFIIYTQCINTRVYTNVNTNNFYLMLLNFTYYYPLVQNFI